MSSKLYTALSMVSALSIKKQPNPIDGNLEYVDVEVNPSVAMNAKGIFINEDADSELFFDYHGTFSDGIPWINQKLLDVAKEFNGYFEWVNPSQLQFVKG